MKKVQEIWKELSDKEKQTQLSIQKVELAVTDDLKAALKEARSLFDTAEKAYGKLEKADSKMVNDIRKVVSSADKVAGEYNDKRQAAQKYASRVATVLDNVERAAKDLGVDFKSISGYSELDKLYNDLEGLPSDYNWTDLRPLVS